MSLTKPPLSSPPPRDQPKKYSPPWPSYQLLAPSPSPDASFLQDDASDPELLQLLAWIVAGGVVILAILCLISCIGFKKRRRRRRRRRSNKRFKRRLPWQFLLPPNSAAGLSSSGTFTYEELAVATNGFSEANLLGQGGFGYVYKGIVAVAKGEIEIAVKELKYGSRQGEREFQAEVEIIGRVHHRHIVSLVGYCITGTRRLLVYEFVPNNTLEFHLHGTESPRMNWPTRLKIALGAAKGLAYLHEECFPKIIHRDIKATNILLDFNFEAKVADFGLAKFFLDANTHVSTRVVGTFGYLDPKYASTGRLTEKSDIFSFGVVLLELIAGRRPVYANQPSSMECGFVNWAQPLVTRSLEDGNFDALVDSKLQNEYNHNELTIMVACATACVRNSARHRPRMSQVVKALEGDMSLSDLNVQFNNEDGNNDQYSTNPTSEYGLSSLSSEGQEIREM